MSTRAPVLPAPPAPTVVPAPPASLAAMIREAVTGPASAMRFEQAGRWHQLSYSDVFALASDTARGLLALGIEPGDRVAILGSTTPEWTLADLGALLAGAVVVPIYHTNSPGECRYVLAHCGARAVFCEDDAQLAKLREVRDACPALEHVVVMAPRERAYGDAIRLDDLRARRDETTLRALTLATQEIAADDDATIVYTSGTTGPPKGAVLTHGNVLATIAMYEDVVAMAPGEQPVAFMFLPLAHVLARLVQFVVLAVGGEIAYGTGDSKALLSDLAATHPTHFPSVPRVFEKVHTAAIAGLEEANPVRRTLFVWAIGRGAHQRALERAGRRPTLLDRAQHVLADRLVLSKVRGLFGGNVRTLLTGAAPLGREVLEFFDACGLVILEGYGLTESCAAATLNTQDAHRFGTVGRPRAGVDVSIAADGEILLRGPMVSPGYLDDEPATREMFGADGWLHTGDLGEVAGDGYVSITGRKKDLIITSSGKNIAPSNIETELQETRWISHAVVFGDQRPYLVALLTLDPGELATLAQRTGAPDADPAQLCASSGVRELLQTSIDRVNAHYATIEQIKRFDVLPRDLTQADGELTPTMKVRRAAVYERYGDRFAELYR
jgi:long-chain acyl-CoA synthetase